MAADPENREQNQILVPEIIKRLRLLRKENEDQKSKADDSFKRPFQMFGGSSTPSSPRKSPSRRMSTGEDEPQLLNARKLIFLFTPVFLIKTLCFYSVHLPGQNFNAVSNLQF